MSAKQIDLSGMTPEQVSRILKSESLADLETAIAPSHAETSARQTQALGAGVPVGSVVLPPVTIGTITLLDAVQSPFVSSDAVGGEVSAGAVALAALIISHGREIAPIISQYAARRARLQRIIDDADDPAVKSAAIEQMVTNEDVLGDLNVEAARLWENELAGASVQDVADAVNQLIIAAAAPFQRLVDAEKKTEATQIQSNGSKTSSQSQPQNSD